MSRRLSLAFILAIAALTLAILVTRQRGAPGKELTEEPPCFASHLGLPCR